MSAAALLAALIPAPSASAISVDETCLLPATRFDSGTLNIAFPDEAAQYWGGVFAGPPGSRVRIEGRYPHTRYFSFNTYDVQLRPTDALTDRDTVPDPGSTNPFLPGANRNAVNREYTAYIETGPEPANPAPNTIHTGEANLAGVFLYRTYIPDRDHDETGGVGLPRAFIELPGGGETEISLIDCTRASKPSGAPLNELITNLELPSELDPISPGGNPRAPFFKFVNLPVAVVGTILAGDSTEELRNTLQDLLVEVGGQGGYLSNVDNAYVSAIINRSFGRVLMVRARAPSFADTRPGVATMPANPQLRYFSMCQNEPLSQRVIACRSDDQTAVGPDGYFTYVISTASQRPANATPSCGVTWIPWGPFARGVLIYRHMLPGAGFTQSIQAAEFRNEAATMGEYLPRAEYFPTRTEFEARGCFAAPGGAALGAVGSSKKGKRKAAKKCRRVRGKKAKRRCLRRVKRRA